MDTVGWLLVCVVNVVNYFRIFLQIVEKHGVQDQYHVK